MYRKNKKVLALVMVMTILVTSFSNLALAEAANKKITIVHVNDVHGRVEADDYEKTIGYGRLKTQVDQLKKENPNTILLNAGDTLHGTTVVNLSEGKAMVDLMNLVGFDAMVPGNHDFNYGYDRLIELKALADFPMITANVIKEEDGKTDFDSYIIKEIDGIKVGIFGLTTDESSFKAHPDNVKGIKFEDPVQAAEKTVKELRDQGADLVIALAHLGIDGTTLATSKDVAEKVEGIDLIIDGHSHEKLNEEVNGTLIAQTGDYVRNIGIVELEVKDKKLAKAEARLVEYEVGKDLEPNKEIEEAIAAIKEENKKVLEVVVGETKVDLNGEREYVRTGETNLGNLITDLMIKYTEGEIAFLNGGDIRDSIQAGEITVDDVLRVFPFTSSFQVIEVTGEDIVKALEKSVEIYPQNAGGFLHVSGMSYKFDASKEAGKRIDPKDVLVADQAIELDKNYKLVTNNFITAGGDGYDMLKDKKIVSDEGLLESDVLKAHLEEVKTIAPTMEGRITVLNDVRERPINVRFKENNLVFPQDMGRPFIKDSRTLVPVRVISERLDHDVKWDEKTRTVTIDGDIKLVIDEQSIEVKGEKLEMDIAPFIKDGRTYVPVRFVTEALEYRVGFDEESRTVLIDESKGEVLPAA